MNHSNIIRLNTDVVEDRYVEILENTHFSLVATVQRLYFMVRNGEKWALDDPKSNEDGMPVIHNVVKMLGCLRIWQDDAGVWPGDAEEFSKQWPVFEILGHISSPIQDLGLSNISHHQH